MDVGSCGADLSQGAFDLHISGIPLIGRSGEGAMRGDIYLQSRDANSIVQALADTLVYLGASGQIQGKNEQRRDEYGDRRKRNTQPRL